MSEHKVGNFTLNGAEMDVFYKLFWLGDQDDGDLPSKSGMRGLIDKGLAVKLYLSAMEKPNMLSSDGGAAARDYFSCEFERLRAENAELKALQEYSANRILALQNKELRALASQLRKSAGLQLVSTPRTEAEAKAMIEIAQKRLAELQNEDVIIENQLRGG